MRKALILAALPAILLMAAPFASAEAVEAVVVDVEGVVDVKRPSDADWVPCVKGMDIPAGTEISTGFEGIALLQFDEHILITVDPLTQGSIDKLLLANADTVDADFKLDIGTIQVDVEKGRYKTDLEIQTPNSTASVTGTEVREIATSPDFGDRFFVTESTIRVTNNQGGSTTVNTGESTNDALVNGVEFRQEEDSTRRQAPMDLSREERLAMMHANHDGTRAPGDMTATQLNPDMDRQVHMASTDSLLQLREAFRTLEMCDIIATRDATELTDAQRRFLYEHRDDLYAWYRENCRHEDTTRDGSTLDRVDGGTGSTDQQYNSIINIGDGGSTGGDYTTR